MSRKTYSLSAIAIAAIAGLSFSSADGAEAFAQDTDGTATESGAVQTEAVDAPASDARDKDDAQEIVFVSEEVVQPLGEAAEGEAIDLGNPFDAGTLPELVNLMPAESALGEQMTCLAGAVYFESRGEPLAGQLAVAQVVINRAEDRRFPASYCSVVYQRAQFSFVKNGRMPKIRTQSAAWQRAKAIARIAHDGLWQSKVGDAVYFHANYVRPKWSYRKQRLAQIDTHIFYR